jgi:hypothetical protein
VVPARSFRHRLSPDPQPSWPLSGRNSTYQIVEICRASSALKFGRRLREIRWFGDRKVR